MPSNTIMTIFLSPSQFFLLAFTMTCSLHDLRTGKIPNSFILCGILAGAAGLFLPGGSPWSRLSGFLLPFLLMGGLVLLSMVGGGDVKLLAVIGLFLGAGAVVRVMIYSVFAGAILSVLLLLKRKNLLRRFSFLRNYLVQALSDGRIRPYRGQESADGEFCFSVPVFLALALQLACPGLSSGL